MFDPRHERQKESDLQISGSHVFQAKYQTHKSPDGQTILVYLDCTEIRMVWLEYSKRQNRTSLVQRRWPSHGLGLEFYSKIK